MKIFYLDESWNTGNDLDNLDQPIHFINGIWIDCEDIPKIEKDIRGLEFNFLPYSKNFDFEFHGIEISGGKKYFKHFNIEDRLKLFESLMNIFKKYDIKFFSQWINKQYLKKRYDNPYHPHHLSFMYIIEKIDIYLEENNDKGLIIMDKNLENEQNIIDNFQEYKNNWTPFGFRRNITSLIDTVYYTDSYNSHIMQLSDVIWYIYSVYKTSEYLWNIKGSNYVRKTLFWYYEDIIGRKRYCDIEPKSSSRTRNYQ